MKIQGMKEDVLHGLQKQWLRIEQFPNTLLMQILIVSRAAHKTTK